MKISSIKQQVKRKDRYAIYIDGKYSFSLGELELINSKLKLGQELTSAELKDLQGRAKLDKAYDRALNYIAIRPRSRWEISDYLKRKKHDNKDIDFILNKLSDSGYVNDESFAQAWVSNRRLLKPISRRKLIMELRQKRVDSSIIEKVLADDETTDISTLQQVVEKKRRRYPDDIKLMRYLASQGYNYQDIKYALKAYTSDD